VVWASDQVVHMPLCEPLLDAAAARALAVTPEGAFAGAALAADPAAIAELLAAPDDAARAWMQRADVVRAEHGAIARHAAGTALERRAAGRYLEQIIHKSQDGPVTRWLYRPVSLPLTRLLLRTPVTPNQVSVLVALLGGLGIWFVAHASYEAVVIGSAIVVVAAYLDGCDGEIARLKLQVSRVGAWLDTIIDELTTVAYMVALGWHNYLRHPEPWVGWSIGFGLATYLLAIYFIYYYLIVVHGSANSQDYVDRLEIVDGRALRPVVSEAPSGLWAVLPHLARRDFINWGALAFAAMHWTDIAYALMLTGGAVTVVKIGLDHLALRRQLRTLRAAG
jgi:phosphatidylglycerophosphate synthase